MRKIKMSKFARLVLCGLTTLLIGSIILNPKAASVDNSRYDVLQARYDTHASGTNLNEDSLNNQSFSYGFGKLFSLPVEGAVYSQPLIATGIDFSGIGGSRSTDAVYVTTMKNMVYAFDTAGHILWCDSLSDPIHPVRMLACDSLGTSAHPVRTSNADLMDIYDGYEGILSTGVIDKANSILYVVSNQYDERVSDGITYQSKFVLYGIALGSGSIMRQQIINGSVCGNSPEAITDIHCSNGGGRIQFDPDYQLQRPALIIVNGYVIISFGSTGDASDLRPPWPRTFHGWIFAYNKLDFTQNYVWNDTPDDISIPDARCTVSQFCEPSGGIWQSGAPPAVEDNGSSIYVMTGNGQYGADKLSGTTLQKNYGSSIVKLDLSALATNNGLQVQDWFTPNDWASLTLQDIDIGVAGAALVNTSSGKFLVGGDKNGNYYVLNRASPLGHLGTTNNANIADYEQLCSYHIHHNPIYWNGRIYLWCEIDETRLGFPPIFSPPNGPKAALQVFSIDPNTGKINPTALIQNVNFKNDGMPSAAMSLSANGTIPGTGILWATKTTNQERSGKLYAFDAATLQVLWDSDQNPERDNLGLTAKFSPPVVSHGQVYVPTFSNRVDVYGMLPPTVPVGTSSYLQGNVHSVSASGSVSLTGNSVQDWAYWHSAKMVSGSSIQDEVWDYMRKNNVPLTQRISPLTVIADKSYADVTGGFPVNSAYQGLQVTSGSYGVGGLYNVGFTTSDAEIPFSPAVSPPYDNAQQGYTRSAYMPPMPYNFIGGGFLLSAPADTNLRTLTVYVGLDAPSPPNAIAELTATLSDNSSPVYDNKVTAAGRYAYTITFKAASANQTLSVKWMRVGSGSNNEGLYMAAAQLSLPCAISSGTPGQCFQPDYTVTTLTDTINGSCTASVCTLRDAISLAAAGKTIGFQTGLTGLIDITALGQFAINKNVSIIGPGENIIKIGYLNSPASTTSFTLAQRIFSVSTSGNFTLQNVSLVNGSAITTNSQQNGGAILNSGGTLIISHVTFSGNVVGPNMSAQPITDTSLSSWNGGAIYNDNNGQISLSDSTFSLNHAYSTAPFTPPPSGTPNLNFPDSGNGGAIFNNSGVINITTSTFQNNSATGVGGAIVNYGRTPASLRLTNSTVQNNRSTGQGGSVHGFVIGAGGGIANSGLLVVSGTTIENNTATLGGGGIGNVGADATVVNSTLVNNTAGSGAGGGIGNATYSFPGDDASWWRVGTMTVVNSTIAYNTAQIAASVYNFNPSNPPDLKWVPMVTLKNTILAEGNIGGMNNCLSVGYPGFIGKIDASDHNLDDGDSCVVVPYYGNGSLHSTDPRFGSFQNNGGNTSTLSLQAISPAVGKGDSVVCASIGSNAVNNVDQRGITRKVSCDIGAYEYITPVPYTATPVPPSSTPTASATLGMPTTTFTPAASATFIMPTATFTSTYALSTPTPPLRKRDTIGIFRPSTATFYLRASNTQGFADLTVQYGNANSYPVVGDWTGGGITTLGVFDPTNGQFQLRNSNTPGAADETFVLGIAGDQPFAGHWQVGATHDGVGVFRPSNGLIYLKNDLGSGFADYTMVLGVPGDMGVAGDWDGNGISSPGIFRPNIATFYLSNQVVNGSVFGDYAVTLGFNGDVPFVGDWVAQGHAGVGVFRPTNGLIYLKNALISGFADTQIVYGIPNDVPVAGHWGINSNPAPPDSLIVPNTPLPATITPTPTPHFVSTPPVSYDG